MLPWSSARPSTRLGFRHPIFVLLLVFALASIKAPPAAAGQAPVSGVPKDVSAMLDRISAQSMKGHLSFLASDLLQGRSTPSPGLDLAAEYVAAQFRRAGLEPAGDDAYFQTALWSVQEPGTEGFSLVLSDGERRLDLRPADVRLPLLSAPLRHRGLRIARVPFPDAQAPEAPKTDAIEGRAVVTVLPAVTTMDPRARAEAFRAQNAFLGQLVAARAAVVLAVSAGRPAPAAVRLLDPEQPARNPLPALPLVYVHDSRVARWLDEPPAGGDGARVAVELPSAVTRPVRLRNVAGLLRGSDPALRDTFVLLTAHYDHLGVRPELAGDTVFNGANDDGSGTVSVIELASALSALKTRPKRSLLFVAFFGEERGLLGSRYYGRHPLVPIERTIADINLEQVGRTDDSEGPQKRRASLTGFDFSEVGEIMAAAGKATGVEVFRHPRNSDAFFGRSDNQALADHGVPAHTLCVAFIFPDYHQPGDHWDKIDYDNMAAIGRTVALALWRLADNTKAPRWNETNPKAARYLEAWRKKQTR
jgi:hypothetical protein